jgi:hypothetical protein
VGDLGSVFRDRREAAERTNPDQRHEVAKTNLFYPPTATSRTLTCGKPAT